MYICPPHHVEQVGERYPEAVTSRNLTSSPTVSLLTYHPPYTHLYPQHTCPACDFTSATCIIDFGFFNILNPRTNNLHYSAAACSSAQAHLYLSSGSVSHIVRTLSSGRQILTVPSSAQVAKESAAQSNAPTSPLWPLSCTPLSVIFPGRLENPTSNKNADPSAPPLAIQRPHGLTLALT